MNDDDKIIALIFWAIPAVFLLAVTLPIWLPIAVVSGTYKLIRDEIAFRRDSNA